LQTFKDGAHTTSAGIIIMIIIIIIIIIIVPEIIVLDSVYDTSTDYVATIIANMGVLFVLI
jgi:hypothetical protein